jgi:predicted MFS family arabinose efflux permease
MLTYWYLLCQSKPEYDENIADDVGEIETLKDKDLEMTAGMALIFSAASGLAVGNLYWAQPLLAAITADFGVPPSQGGFLVTATQLGYALGILLIVPLGDILERRKLLITVMLLTVAGLLCSAVASSFAVLAVSLGRWGLSPYLGRLFCRLWETWRQKMSGGVW